ncbi:hypothetical protein VPMS16_2950 [Vibrio sp. 16]|nr:hypothetical protein VPMS16_2950 [Vibrio sp. 16]
MRFYPFRGRKYQRVTHTLGKGEVTSLEFGDIAVLFEEGDS